MVSVLAGTGFSWHRQLLLGLAVVTAQSHHGDVAEFIQCV